MNLKNCTPFPHTCLKVIFSIIFLLSHFLITPVQISPTSCFFRLFGFPTYTYGTHCFGFFSHHFLFILPHCLLVFSSLPHPHSWISHEFQLIVCYPSNSRFPHVLFLYIIPLYSPSHTGRERYLDKELAGRTKAKAKAYRQTKRIRIRPTDKTEGQTDG